MGFVRGRQPDHFTAFPVRLIICGVLDALSLIVREPVIVPLVVGANFTEILQLLPCDSSDVQVLVSMKPVVVEMLETLSEAAPLSVSLTVLAGLLLPTFRFPKLKLVGLTVPIDTGVGVAVGVAV